MEQNVFFSYGTMEDRIIDFLFETWKLKINYLDVWRRYARIALNAAHSLMFS